MSAAERISSARSQPARRATSTSRMELDEFAGAHDQHDVRARGDGPHRLLPVGGGVADVLAARALDRREAPPQRGHDLGRVGHRERGLGGERELCRVGDLDPLRILHGLHQQHAARQHLAHGPDHLGMAGMAHQQHGAALPVMALHLAVHLGDQRTGRVRMHELAPLGFGRHTLGHAMRREDDHRAVRHLVQLADEDRTQPLQLVDHMPVVDDLVPHIDRRPVLPQRLLDDRDGALDPGTEAARAREQDGERRQGWAGQAMVSGWHEAGCQRS